MSRPTYPTDPIRVHISGLAGSNSVRFLATIKHGNGTPDVAVDVPPEVILRLADCIRATADGACDGKHHRHCPVGEQYVCGHAVWHYDHPADPMPCIDHDSVIDMNALPSGEGKP